ncbi:MAG: acetyl/propionyl/methylcrotonyl-CoA carboxylase subunit alpha [Phototrophicaceae bacterium]
MIRKLLIANRGEITCRIIRTCRKLGIMTVAIFSDSDATALHVQMADEAVYIGANNASESYLNIEKIISVAQQTGADAIHPGYGFLAENAEFAQAVLNANITWVGPQPEVITLMGDKGTAKNTLENIPYVPGYNEENQADDTLISVANEIGYPIMIKATAGGGGKGMRSVDTAEDMLEALASARREAQQSFGNDTLMLEKRIIKPRHIEVQIIGDTYGNVIALGERECSIQRRHQKIVEESPAYGLDDDLRKRIHQSAVQVGEQLNYQNAGTVEFLLDSDDNFYFMEMNTRLQVEHPVTEAVFGVDLVQWQLEIAQGTSLADLLPASGEISPNGHAIEVRVYAEDPNNNFLPVTGDIIHWQAPDTVRVDAGVQSGDTISPHYDPMIAKVIAHGHNRTTAIRKLDYALAQLKFMGIRNNVAFLQRVITHPEHISGNISTQFLDDYPNLMSDTQAISAPAIIAVALAQGTGQSHWRNNPNRPIRHRFMHNDTLIEVFFTANKNSYKFTIGDNNFDVILKSVDNNTYTLVVDGRQQRFTVISGKNEQWWVQSLEGTFRLDWQTPLPLPNTQKAEKGSLRAPMPGQVIRVDVEVGQSVEQGDILLIMEAMKMEHRIEAPYSGTVEKVAYGVGDTVQQDDVLLAIKADDE